MRSWAHHLGKSWRVVFEKGITACEDHDRIAGHSCKPCGIEPQWNVTWHLGYFKKLGEAQDEAEEQLAAFLKKSWHGVTATVQRGR